MPAEHVAFHVVYVSIESAADDATATAERILRDERVLAGVRAADGGDALALIPVTEDGTVIALDAEGRLRFDLSDRRLREAFAAEGIILRLGVDERADDPGDGGPLSPDPSDSVDDFAGAEEIPAHLLAEPEPVRVAEFSRRSAWAARITAQLIGAPVHYRESGTWSLYRYATDRAHMALSGSRADGAIIELNIPQRGTMQYDEAWVEVTSPASPTGMFWPNSQRLTRPVLDVSTIAVPESAELYRRMLVEADGTQDELAGLSGGVGVDQVAALRACTPEAIGGVPGEVERLRAFLTAFGVPSELIDAALAEEPGGEVFTGRGWGQVIGDLLLSGWSETVPLTRRQRPLVRAARWVRQRPLLGAAISTSELAGGVALTRSRSKVARGFGVVLVIDALIDLVIWAVRMRRR
ncbi:hypothetical protein ACWIBQ_10425 [Microbacterium keratanolyticum]